MSKRVVDGELNWEGFIDDLEESPFINYPNILFNIFRHHMSNIFTYENLPEELPEEVIEYILFQYGQGIFYIDVDKEFTFLPFGGIMLKNKYGIPNEVTTTPLDASMITPEIVMVGTEGIIMKAFYDLNVMSPRMLVQPLVYNMSKIMTKKYTNLLDSNIALIYEVESGQQKTTEKDLKKIFNTDKSFKVIVNDGVNKVNQFNDLEIPYKQADFWEDYHTCKSEILNMLGINSNDNVDKKERMNVPEVDANNEESNNILGSMLKARESAIEKVNKKFGTNISVKLNKPEPDEEIEEEEEVEDDE